MPKNCSHEGKKEKKIDKAEALHMPYPRESNFNTFHLTTVELLPRRTKDT